MSGMLKGKSYIGTQTVTNRGKREFRDVVFIASRDQDPEEFIRDRDGTPDQDRVFVVYEKFGSVPRLFVAGSIRPGVAA